MSLIGLIKSPSHYKTRIVEVVMGIFLPTHKHMFFVFSRINLYGNLLKEIHIGHIAKPCNLDGLVFL